MAIICYSLCSEKTESDWTYTSTVDRNARKWRSYAALHALVLVTISKVWRCQEHCWQDISGHSRLSPFLRCFISHSEDVMPMPVPKAGSGKAYIRAIRVHRSALCNELWMAHLSAVRNLGGLYSTGMSSANQPLSSGVPLAPWLGPLRYTLQCDKSRLVPLAKIKSEPASPTMLRISVPIRSCASSFPDVHCPQSKGAS